MTQDTGKLRLSFTLMTQRSNLNTAARFIVTALIFTTMMLGFCVTIPTGVKAATSDIVTLDVDTVLDSNDAAYQACTAAPDDCSLRGAIERANDDPGNSYHVSLMAGTYQLTLVPDETPDDNADGDLDILGTVEIWGAGTDTTIIQAGDDPDTGIDRLFHVADTGAELTLHDLTLRYGRGSGNGGAIWNEGTLSVQSVTVAGNTAVGQKAVGGKGGAIYSLGDLSLVNSTLDGNTATNEGTGVQTGGNLCGGGIYNEGGTVTMTGTLVTGNITHYSGGGLYSAGGTVTISSTQIVSNTGEGSAGAYIASGTADVWSGTIAYNTAGDFGCGGIKNLGNLTVTDSSIAHNTAQSNGSGICNEGTLTVTGSTISNNAGKFSGGGIFNEGGTVSLSASSVISNAVTDSGGGIYSKSGNIAIAGTAITNNSANGAGGGGIYAESSKVYILASTLAENRATGSANGGGILNGNNTLDIANSTLSGNTAAGLGGGIYNEGALLNTSAINISNCTFVGNTAGNGGAVANQNNWFGITTARIENSIMTGNTGGDCINNGTISGSNNLIDDHAAGACSGISSAAVTGLETTLHDNGSSGSGPVLRTHMLLPGSNAIDAVPDGACNYAASPGNPLFADGAPISTDQRGEGRPLDYDRDGNSLCDIGAFERQDTETYTAAVDDGATLRFGAAMTFIEENLGGSAPGGSTPGETTVTRVNEPPGGGTPHPGEMPFYVMIQPAVETGLDLNLTLCYTEWELNALDENDLVLFRYSETEEEWIVIEPDVRDTTGNCVTKTHVTDLSIWTLGTATPTAVSLVSLSARTAPAMMLGLGTVASCIAFAAIKPRKRHAKTDKGGPDRRA